MKSMVPESINFIYIVPVQPMMKVPVCRLNVNNFVLELFARATSKFDVKAEESVWSFLMRNAPSCHKCRLSLVHMKIYYLNIFKYST